MWELGLRSAKGWDFGKVLEPHRFCEKEMITSLQFYNNHPTTVNAKPQNTPSVAETRSPKQTARLFDKRADPAVSNHSFRQGMCKDPGVPGSNIRTNLWRGSTYLVMVGFILRTLYPIPKTSDG